MTLTRSDRGAFDLVKGILGFPGRDAVGKVDPSIVGLQIDLAEAVASSVAVPAVLSYRGTMPMAGASHVIPFDPYSSGFGDADARSLEVASGVQAIAGVNVRPTWDAWLIDFGITNENSNLTTTSAYLYADFIPGVVPVGYPGQYIRPLWRGDSEVTIDSLGVLLNTAVNPERQPFPMRMPSASYDNGSTDRFRIFYTGAGAPADVTYVAAGRLVLVPEGTLGPI